MTPNSSLTKFCAVVGGLLIASAVFAVDATVPTDFATISSAVRNATDVDTNGVVEILVLAGIYPEAVEIKRSNLELAGEAAATTTIVGPGTVATVRIKDATNVTLRNLTVTSVAGLRNGLKITDATDCQVDQNIFQGNKHGISLRRVDGCVLVGNEVRFNVSAGIKIREGDDNLVALNAVHDNGKNGIVVRPGSGNLIQTNTVTDNLNNGIRIRETTAANTVEDNTISGSGSNGINLRETVGTVLVGNVSTGSLKNGLRMRDTVDSLVSANDFVSNSGWGVRRRDWTNDDFDGSAAGVQDPPGDNDLSGNTLGPLRED